MSARPIYTLRETGERFELYDVLPRFVVLRQLADRSWLGVRHAAFADRFERETTPGTDDLLDLARAVGVVPDPVAVARPGRAGAQPATEFAGPPLHPAMRLLLNDQRLAAVLAQWAAEDTGRGEER